MARTVKDIVDMKKNGKKISVLTSYDYALASLCDKAGVDILLVGDSAGMVVLGYDDTLQVTMEQMEIFVGAVSRAKQNALVVGDLPFMSYQASITDAITNSGRLIKAGADCVKLEGGAPMADTVNAIVEIGIPVMGHIGFQPQTTMLSEGYKVQGRTADGAIRLIEDAKALEQAGAFSIVFEMVSNEVDKISIPELIMIMLRTKSPQTKSEIVASLKKIGRNIKTWMKGGNFYNRLLGKGLVEQVGKTKNETLYSLTIKGTIYAEKLIDELKSSGT